jgi:hypothetical protein
MIGRAEARGRGAEGPRFPDPSALIPHDGFRAAVDRLLDETPAPPDDWIDEACKSHFGRLGPAEVLDVRATVRRYAAMRLELEGVTPE